MFKKGQKVNFIIYVTGKIAGRSVKVIEKVFNDYVTLKGESYLKFDPDTGEEIDPALYPASYSKITEIKEK